MLFAEDAAHLVPIFGVRGLNSGIDDAHNLGWKLAMVARGEAPEALLDSYSHERRRATRENLEQATKSTWFMSPPSAGFSLMRDAVLSLAAEHAWASALVNPRQSSAHVYDDSPAVQPDATTCEAGVKPGEPLPNSPVAAMTAPGAAGAGRHLHDALPPRGFALLVFVDTLGDPKQVTALLAAPGFAGVPLELVLVGSERGLAAAEGAGAVRRITDTDGALAEQFAARSFPVYLVRPDEHVAARLQNAAPAAVSAALDVALGRRPAPRVAGAERAGASGETSTPNTPHPITPPSAEAEGGALGQEGLERVFEAISVSVDAAGETEASHFLARLSLLLAEEVGDAERVLALVAAAQEGRKRPGDPA